MFGVSHGSFALQDHLDPLQQAGQSEAEGCMGKTGEGGRKHWNLGMLRRKRHPSLGTPPRKI